MNSNSSNEIPRPKIDIENIIDYSSYRMNSKKYKCSLCEQILLNPIMCSQCKTIFCRNCIFPYTLKHNSCPNDCKDFDLEYPDSNQMKTFSKFDVLCKLCENIFPITKYQSHYNKCSLQNEKLSCWNCNNITFGKEMKYLTYKEYSHLYKYNKNINLEDDKPFTIYISTSDLEVNGYLSSNGSYLVCFSNRNFASILSEIVINNKTYMKIYEDCSWKFLRASYTDGVTLTNWDYCSSINIDRKGKEMICNEGLFVKNSKLFVRKKDRKLFFNCDGEEGYLKCIINVNYLD